MHIIICISVEELKEKKRLYTKSDIFCCYLTCIKIKMSLQDHKYPTEQVKNLYITKRF